VKGVLIRLVNEEDGQDLVEYSLLLAFVCMASAALFSQSGTSMANIWTVAQATLVNAKTAASS
jgi:Flp pilus assembly pilin Flp